MDELSHHLDGLGYYLPFANCKCVIVPPELPAAQTLEQALDSSWREFDSGVKALLQKGAADA